MRAALAHHGQSETGQTPRPVSLARFHSGAPECPALEPSSPSPSLLVVPDDVYPPQSFLPHTLFSFAMHLFFWLFLIASTSHAIHVPISRYKFSSPSPLEKRAQGHGGLSYNVLAAGNSSKDLKSVHYPISISSTFSLDCEPATSVI